MPAQMDAPSGASDCTPDQTSAVNIPNGAASSADGVWQINAAGTPDIAQIVGFTVTYRLTAGGSLGGGFPINAVVFSPGTHTAEAFSMDYSGAFPTYAGTAPELVIHATGDNAHVGGIFFAKGIDGGALEVGATATVHYDGTAALFGEGGTVLSVFGLFDTGIEIVSAEWTYGTPSEGGDEPTWMPVPSRTITDIQTVYGGTDATLIDITIPEGEGTFPVIFWIHGGAWQYLDKSAVIISSTKQYLLAQGYAFVSANYTLNTEVDGHISGSYPQMIFDLKAAIRFLRANASEYQLDTSFIAAMGESAGGHLAMLLGTTNGSEIHEDLTMGNAGHSSDVQAMISYFGPSDMVGDPMVNGSESTEQDQRDASPYWQLTAGDVPLFLAHGENDGAVPSWHSHKMEEKARGLLGSRQVTSLYFEDGPHGSKAVFDAQTAIDAVSGFLARHLESTATIHRKA